MIEGVADSEEKRLFKFAVCAGATGCGAANCVADEVVDTVGGGERVPNWATTGGAAAGEAAD